MKKTIAFLSSIVILGSIGAGANYIPEDKVEAQSKEKVSDEAFEIFKQERKLAKEDSKQLTQSTTKENKQKYITIGNSGYSKLEFEKFKSHKNLFKRLKNEKLWTKKEIQKQFIEQKALYKEAKKKGLVVSKQEAVDYANKIKEFHKNADQSREDVKIGKEMAVNYQEALGITEEEYYNDYLVSKYQIILSVGKVKQDYAEELAAKEAKRTQENNSSNRMNGMSAKEFQQKWGEHVSDLVNNTPFKINE